MANSTSPDPASEKASTVVGRFAGISDPRVSIEEPLSTSARRRGRSPSDQTISM